MASLFRIGVCRLATGNNEFKLLRLNKNAKFVRTITSKSTRTEKVQKPAPWPYKTKRYTFLQSLYDRTVSRFDENSKLLVVEGPVAAGKSEFAKQVAEELDMLYLPEANLDMLYYNEYGYDLRKLDELLPESCRSWDVMDFLMNPSNKLTTRFQLTQYQMRYSQYIDALAHILSTGQGVVLDRSPYSDFVFVEAMYSQGYLSKIARSKYYEYRDNTIGELMRPHLVIYLDVPVPKVLENIQKRNISYEKNSPVLTSKYLEVMEKKYKQDYLKTISNHSELLIYDWSEKGEVEIVIEDIERIDFDHYDVQDTKMQDWDHQRHEEWNALRHYYADKKDYIMGYFNIPAFEVPELCVEPEDAQQFHEVWRDAPGNQYLKGYNSNQGDKGILFKLGVPHRETLPVRERRKV